MESMEFMYWFFRALGACIGVWAFSFLLAYNFLRFLHALRSWTTDQSAFMFVKVAALAKGLSRKKVSKYFGIYLWQLGKNHQIILGQTLSY